MSKFLQRMCFVVCILPLASGVYAVEVSKLNEAVVSANDHSEKALAAASREALSEVLVKISGSEAVLQNPSINSQLERARGYVRQYSYTRDQDADGDLAARIEFDSNTISKILIDAGAPLWTANRPAVLVWMVIQDQAGTQFVNWEQAPAAMKDIQVAFERRGVPLRFPLFDLQDSAALSPEDGWRLRTEAIVPASQRYSVQDVLVGRVTMLSTGEWVGDWAYFTGDNRIDVAATVDSLEGFIGAGVAFVAEDMAGRYAVATTGNASEGIEVQVAGVADYATYAQIISWLEGLELIEHANVELIRGDDITIRLSASTDAANLKPIIELNRRLVPVTDMMTPDMLRYQWQP